MTLVLALFVTFLTPFSAAAAMEKNVKKQQEELSYAEIEKKIIEKEMQEIDLNQFDQIEVFEGFASAVPKQDRGQISPYVVLDPGTQYWQTIATGTKTLKKSDFYIQGARVYLLTTLIGWYGVSANVLAGVLGVAATAIPDSLPGEKVHMIKKLKWVDQKNYIYDVRTTEYIQRNGKTVTIYDQTIRENGWGN